MSGSNDRQEKRGQWKERILRWQVSGKSGASWCREEEVNYEHFLYWKTRFAPEGHKGFVELHDGGTGAGIVLSFQGLSIELERGFDGPTLQRLLLIVGS